MRTSTRTATVETFPMVTGWWTPSRSWRWVSGDAATPVHLARLRAEFSEAPLELAQRGLVAAFEAGVSGNSGDAAGPWLVAALDHKWAQVQGPARRALSAFLELAPAVEPGAARSSWLDALVERIPSFAAEYGWLGRPEPVLVGADHLEAEPLRAWCEELALLRACREVLDACDRVEHSEARRELGKAADRQFALLAGAHQRMAFQLELTEAGARGSIPAYVAALRGAVRKTLQAQMQGEFSPVLVSDGGPVERFQPATLAAALELELARRAVQPGRPWRVCAAPGCGERFPVHRGGGAPNSHVYCGDTCRKRARRVRGQEAVTGGKE